MDEGKVCISGNISHVLQQLSLPHPPLSVFCYICAVIYFLQKHTVPQESEGPSITPLAEHPVAVST